MDIKEYGGCEGGSLPDFPKVQCPFVRKTYEVCRKDWKRFGKELGLRSPEVYLVGREVVEGMEWVFEEGTYAVEKLHGTNISLEIFDGRLARVGNRKNDVDVTRLIGRKSGLLPSGRILEGIVRAVELGYIREDGIHYGELVGPKVNGNIHKLDGHLWVPFDHAVDKLRYSSFNKHPKEFDGWSGWFRLGLKSLLYCRLNKSSMTSPNVPFTEGVVIYDEGGRMAKLRRDMFDWYYGDKIRIHGLEEWRVEAAAKGGYSLKGYI